MTAAKASKPASTTNPEKKATIQKHQLINTSTQARFATSKLIQNLGSSNDGIQFNFVSDLRTAHGRD